jgi:4-hydroxybenzoate polyprenyltransferase
MATVEALGSDDITKVGVIITIALVIVAVLLSFVITAVIGRIVIVVVLAALVAFVWQQRGHVQDEINANKCNLHATFFGYHLDAPQSVINECRRRT